MNNNKARFFYTDAEVDAVTSRYALRVTARLSEADVPHDISERLRVAREQAVQRAAAARRQVATAAAASGAVHTVSVGGSAAALGAGSGPQSPRWWGWMSVLPVLAMLAGLWLIDHHWDRSQIEAAADIDSALLADDVPPVAYSDAGFVEFLKAPQP